MHRSLASSGKARRTPRAFRRNEHAGADVLIGVGPAGNQLGENPLRRDDLDDFVSSYAPGRLRSARIESARWKSFAYDELVARDKVNLDITWLRDESLEDADNLPSPEVIAREIVEDLTAALVEFEAVAAALESANSD